MPTALVYTLAAAHLPAVRAIIDDVALFPSDLLDEMTAPFLAATMPEEHWFVLLEDGTAQAVAYCAPERLTDGTWNLLLIAVRGARQGHGLGSALTRHVERQLRELGARVLLVETSGMPEFERTRAVYRRLGYAEVARIPDYYAAGDDKLVFWKQLQASA